METFNDQGEYFKVYFTTIETRQLLNLLKHSYVIMPMLQMRLPHPRQNSISAASTTILGTPSSNSAIAACGLLMSLIETATVAENCGLFEDRPKRPGMDFNHLQTLSLTTTSRTAMFAYL